MDASSQKPSGVRLALIPCAAKDRTKRTKRASPTCHEIHAFADWRTLCWLTEVKKRCTTALLQHVWDWQLRRVMVLMQEHHNIAAAMGEVSQSGI